MNISVSLASRCCRSLYKHLSPWVCPALTQHIHNHNGMGPFVTPGKSRTLCSRPIEKKKITAEKSEGQRLECENSQDVCIQIRGGASTPDLPPFSKHLHLSRQTRASRGNAKVMWVLVKRSLDATPGRNVQTWETRKNTKDGATGTFSQTTFAKQWVPPFLSGAKLDLTSLQI